MSPSIRPAALPDLHTAATSLNVHPFLKASRHSLSFFLQREVIGRQRKWCSASLNQTLITSDTIGPMSESIKHLFLLCAAATGLKKEGTHTGWAVVGAQTEDSFMGFREFLQFVRGQTARFCCGFNSSLEAFWSP